MPDKSLDKAALENTYQVLQKIYLHHKQSGSVRVRFRPFNSTAEPTWDDETDILKKLHGEEIIALVHEPDDPESYFVIELNLEKFKRYYQKIASKKRLAENSSHTQYLMSFDPITGILRINDTKIKKTHYQSTPGSLLEYIVKHSNQDIKKEDLKDVKITSTRGLDDIIRGLGLSQNMLKAFFPILQNNIIHFRNPVLLEDLNKLGLSKL